jgi:hypothetical protein
MARHCGYCHTQGHNKRTCESMTNALKRRRREYLDRDASSTDGENSIAREGNLRRLHSITSQIAKRTGVHPVTGAKVAKRVLSRPRRCSYCREEGHTRRTCSVRKRDQNVYREATRIARRTVADRIKAIDIGIGTLCVHAMGYYDSNNQWAHGDRACIITGVRWDDYTYDSSSFQLTGIPVAQLGRDRQYTNISLSQLENTISGQGRPGQGRRQVTPAGALSFTEEWLNAEDIDWKVIEGFRDSKQRSYRFSELEHERTRKYAPQILVTACNNLGYASPE